MPPRATAPVTVLVVDDDPSMCRVTGRLLARMGYRVFEARSAAEALAQLERTHVDVVLTDFVMPGMTGCQLAKSLSKHWPHVTTVMMSGMDGCPACEGWDGGFIQKPFKLDELLRCVAEATRRPRA